MENEIDKPYTLMLANFFFFFLGGSNKFTPNTRESFIVKLETGGSYILSRVQHFILYISGCRRDGEGVMSQFDVHPPPPPNFFVTQCGQWQIARGPCYQAFGTNRVP